MPRILRLACVSLVVLLAACGERADEGDEQASTGPAHVGVQPLAEVLQPRQVSAPASVRARNESELSSDVSARVERIHADVGAAVAAGDLLLELDDTDYRLALAQADARVASARSRVSLARQRHERGLALIERQFISADEVLALDTELQAARGDLAVAEADRRVASRNVEKCRVTAPFDGVVLERMAQVGNLAPAGSALMRLVDVEGAEVEASLQDADAESLAQARELVFESQGQRHRVDLLRVTSVVERSARTRVARLGFVDDVAPPGSTGTLRWQLPATQLPASLLVRRGDALGVFVVEDGHARFVPVPDASEGRPFGAALPEGAAIVTSGQQGLNDGQAVAAHAADGTD